MNGSTMAEIEALRSLKATDLRNKYREVFIGEPRSWNRDFLFRRIAWELQSKAAGGLSDRAFERISEIAGEAERIFRERPVTNGLGKQAEPSGGRSPSSKALANLPVGAVLTRSFDRRCVVVTVLADGFEYQSRKYRSLSAIAREVTGTQWSGPRFFGLAES